MCKTKIPPPAKLIIGLIYKPEGNGAASASRSHKPEGDGLASNSQSHKQNSVKDKVLDILKRRFGEIDFLSRRLDFNYTDYYYPEFGRPLKRLFVSFKQLTSEDKLSGIKAYTNKLEKRFSRKEKRQINIDPGFLSLGKVILATTKNYSHRVYLGNGIFAEATLFYKDATFKPWPWAYPDYQSKEYIAIFNSIRRLLPGERAENAS